MTRMQIIGIVLILGAIVCVIYGIRSKNHNLELSETGKHAVAVVVDCKEFTIPATDDYSVDETSYEQVVEYDGHQQVLGTSEHCSVGDRINVIYNREDPTDVIEEGKERVASTAAYIIAGFWLVLGGLMIKLGG